MLISKNINNDVSKDSPITARAKMSLSRARNIFMPASVNSIVLSNWSQI